MDPEESSLAIAYTLDFVGFYLPKKPSRVLEIGRGVGPLTTEIAKLGHAVVALDSADARQDLLSFVDDEPFDVILFVDSLHRAIPLGETLRKARSLLAPHGILLIEDSALRAKEILAAVGRELTLVEEGIDAANLRVIARR